MKFRNKFVAKRIGTTTLASLLVFGMVLSSPLAALADGEENAPVMETTVTDHIQAKKTDGSEELVTISDQVQEMLQREEIRLNEETGYLEDVLTGEKVNPETGERLKEAPAEPDLPEQPEKPDTPETPDPSETPTQPDTPESPQEPTVPEQPTDPEKPEDPEVPEVPEEPAIPETPEISDHPEISDKKEEQPIAGDSIDHTKEIEKAKESASQEETKEVVTNSELIRRQQIIKQPEIVEDFRFWTVARKYAFAKTAINVREEIPKDVNGQSDFSDQAKADDIKAAQKDAKELKSKFNTENQKYNIKKTGQTSKKEKKVKLTGLNIFSTIQLHAKAEKKAASQAAKVKEQQKLQKQEEEKNTKVAADLAAQQMQEKVRSVGKVSQDGLLYILKEEENGWLYVESGNVRGFVKASEVYTEEAAQELLDVYQTQAKFKAAKEKKDYTGIEGTASTAEALVDASENRAYTYLRATVNPTVADKNPALVTKKIENEKSGILNIQEEAQADSKVVGTMTPGTLCYILADQDKEWVYVESGDVRGFVEKKYLDFDETTKKQIQTTGERNYPLATEKIAPEDNKALYYTLSSTRSGTPSGEIRQSMLEYASQFIGNPYVWGGTSLTNGADCSGFVQQIYKAYGYDLPRVAEDQSQYGTKIPVEDAAPGDLIFYAKNGYVYHVVMYAGDGKTIEAANENVGIICGTVYQKDAVWATRILKDNETIAGGGLGEVDATPDMYGTDLGNFTITYYCACEICCNKADGITATGTPVVEGQTIAVDPSVIPYGTKVIIGGHVFTAEDCGGAIKQNHIDVYVNSHEEALALGVTNAEVYLAK